MWIEKRVNLCRTRQHALWLYFITKNKLIYCIIIIQGFSVVKEMEKYGTRGGNPTAQIIIENCGELKLEKQNVE